MQGIVLPVSYKKHWTFSKWFHFSGTKVSTYSLAPGFVATELYKTTPIMQTSYFDKFLNSLVGYFVKSPMHGAATTICCAVDKEIEKDTGKFYS